MTDKVVSLEEKKKELEDNGAEPPKEKTPEELAFEEIMRKNEENRLRMKKDREKANKGVIRSYRLK